MTGNIQSLIRHLRYTRGVTFFSTTTHSNRRTTDPIMLSYLPTDLTKLSQTTQIQSGIFIVYKTGAVWNHILKWAFLCSLEEKCIAPTNRFGGCWFHTNMTQYSGCHRYDQSLVNVLAMNWYGAEYDTCQVVFKHNIFKIERVSKGEYELQVCNP